MNRKIAVATSLAILFGLSACNTVNGAGEDLKSAGEAVSGASGEQK